MSPSPEPLFEIEGVSKRFGAVEALRSVDLKVYPGEVHALVGENGAGKSTLMKILSGAYRPDGGSILASGSPYRVDSCVEARRQGVAMIYQELTLAPHLTVAHNLTLGMEQNRFGFAVDDRAGMRRALASLGHGDIDLDAPVRSLSIGTQQVVEIARALICDARLVIMDEPTSSLSAHDAEALFGVIDRLASSGMAVIYISHFLEEIRAVAHRYTVLRDGSTVATGLLRDVTLDALVETMVGRELAEMFPRIAHEPGESVLTVTGLRATTGPRGVDLELRRGEILGIAGLVGSGRSETIRSLFGLHAVRSGTLTLRGSPVDLVSWTPAQALASGLDLLSENRKEEGLATRLATRINVCLSSLGRLARYGFVDHRRERAEAVCWRDRLAIKCPDVDAPVEALSGGNQQKVALARNLLHDSDILFLDEPTRGIDIGSKAEICRTIGELAASGKAVVMVSSYLPELLGVCDRIGVMHRGRLSPVRPVAEWTEESIMHFATTGRMRRAEGAHNARPGRESGSPNVRALAE